MVVEGRGEAMEFDGEDAVDPFGARSGQLAILGPQRCGGRDECDESFCSRRFSTEERGTREQE